MTMRNNIFYGSGCSGTTNGIQGDTQDADYNLWYPSKDSDDKGSSSIVGDPLFTSRSTKDFTLTESSPAINAGAKLSYVTTDINQFPRDASPDIGAHEWQGSSQDYQCSDGTDNDRDGLTDMKDPDCTSTSDNSEFNSSSLPSDAANIVDIDPSGTYIDAENFSGTINQGTGTFILETSQFGYIGNGYLRSSGGESSSCPPSEEGKEYEVNFTSAGTYKVWMRGYATGDSDNSVFIGIDGKCAGALRETSYDQWSWTNSTQTGSNTITVTDTSVPHKINIWVREADHLIDRIYITQNADSPDDIPPAPPIMLMIE